MTDWSVWCRFLISSLADGGTWVVPRSGLIFTKTGERSMRLTDRMPHTPELDWTEQELVFFQDADFDTIRDEFARAGITVTR